jgi:N-acetylglucosaminyl-diphospho-decaprenol L-rhamnosyltransferase
MTTSKVLNYSVVIVEYFSGHHLLECIDSLFEQTHAPDKVVVVINGIDDTFREQVQQQHPDVHLIDPHDNLGYARAANLGIAATQSDVVLTLNPDTVLEKDCAEEACHYLAVHDNVGAVGPQILELNGEIYPSARNEPNVIDAIGHGLLGLVAPNNPFTRRYKNLDAGYERARTSDWLSGAAQFLRRQALDDIGGWDEDFFMYCEDIDLGRRMRLEKWNNAYVPQARLVHVQGVSTDRAPLSLVVEHHKSLSLYARKKYDSLLMRLFTQLFIAIRLPVALIVARRRIN